MRYTHIILLVLMTLSGQQSRAFFASDGDFAPGTWTTEFFTIGALQGNDTASAVTDRFVGGNGPFMLHQYSVDIGANSFYRLKAPVFLNDFVYDPGVDGAIESISASIKTLNVAVAPGVEYGTTWVQLFIKQDGEYYGTALLTNLPLELGDPDKIHTATGLEAEDFARLGPNSFIDFSSHPDFSGGAMQFGFAQVIDYFNFSEALGPMTLVAGFDDVSVRISEVPEPATLSLLGLGATMLIRKRR